MPKKRGSEHHRWTGGRRIDRDGYVWVYCPEHPKAHYRAVQEHRLVMEKQLGRYLLSSEQVHHINGDRQDNRPENLVVLTRREHAMEHGLGSVNRGRKLSEETKQKISEACSGKARSSRGKKKTGAALEASRENIKKAQASRRRPH